VVGSGLGGTSPSKRLYDQMKGSAVYKVSLLDDREESGRRTTARVDMMLVLTLHFGTFSVSGKIFLYPSPRRITNGLPFSSVPLTTLPLLKDPEAQSPSL